jgi:FKBP-type peptidyl-prolyl cis-trans isomerase SlyD
VIPGLEKAMQGLKVGDTKQITVTPEEGYGSVDPSAFAEIPKAQLPAGVSPEVGMVLRGVNPDGQSFQARVKEIKDQTVMLDLNHPLAGKTLNFDIKVTDIKPAPPQQ